MRITKLSIDITSLLMAQYRRSKKIYQVTFFILLFQMRQSLVPVLLLATVALSSSNILPVMSTKQLHSNTLGIDGQLNDNILSNRFNTDVFNNIVYAAPTGTSQNYQLLKKYIKYDINNDPAEDRFVDIVREDNYDGEGFRKEQWHNYPRQLDRLHKYLFEHQNANNHIPETGDNDDVNVYDESGDEIKKIDNESNEYVLNSNENVQDMYGAHVAVDPLVILKIHLAYLSNQMKNSGLNNLQRLENKRHEVEIDEKDLTNHIDPGIKVKQEGVMNGNQISGRYIISQQNFIIYLIIYHQLGILCSKNLGRTFVYFTSLKE